MTFGLEWEPFPLVAIALALLVVASPRARHWLWQIRLERFVLAASAAAALVSVAYVAAYLRGGPRIVDATTYYLEARAISEGRLAWAEGDPSEVGRFLVRDAGGSHVAGIFPPGYPAILAIGFLLGAPMMIGPCLAFGVTWATGSLARAALATDAAVADGVTRLAVLLSVVCGALRYHTADTMSHGLAALCATVGLACAYRLRESRRARDALGAGAALGLLVAARPFSGAALALVMAFLLGRRASLRSLVLAALAGAPFLALLIAHQHAATGEWLQSSQAVYYANSDGPNGCFRYGFGAGIGCLHEHGDFVRHNLRDGYGLVAAAGTSLRRLKMHGVDALNAEPLAIALLVPALLAAMRRPAVRALACMPLALLALYAPFYFDGNYPGGGARLLSDGLAAEHVLVAWFWTTLAMPWLARRHRLRVLAAPHWLVAASLLGFALRAANDHRLLRDREGGRPMFEPEVLEAAGVQAGLLFVDTDHGFGLAFAPTRAPLQVARYRGDHFDWLTWQAAGRPPAFRYDYDFDSGRARVTSFDPQPMPALDAANLWPPRSQRRGFVLPVYGASACAGRERVLELFGAAGNAATVDFALPSGLAGASLAPIVTHARPGAVIELLQGEALLGSWQGEALSESCHPASPIWLPREVDSDTFMLRVRLPAAADGGALGLAALAVGADKSNLEEEGAAE